MESKENRIAGKEVDLLDYIKNSIDSVYELDLFNETRKQKTVDAKRIFALLAADLFSFTDKEIASKIKKARRSICYYRMTAKNLLETNRAFRMKYQACKRRLSSIEE